MVNNLSKLNKALRIVERDRNAIGRCSRLAYYPVVAAHASGAHIWDVDGNDYIDFLAGAATLTVGHTHPKVVAAVKEQAERLLHYAMVYEYNELPVRLAERLNKLAPGPFKKKTVFGLSGSGANDIAMKLARAATSRIKLVGFLQGYHGSTFGALSLTAVSLGMRRKLGPLVPECYHIPYANCFRCPFSQNYPDCGLTCLEYVKFMFENYIPLEEVAAIIPEPIQGDSGIIIPPEEWVRAFKELCSENGILFASEEVQCGFGRTGRWFGIQHFGVDPDMIIFGKAISAGVPLSGVIAREDVADAAEAPACFLTTKASPLSCAAALAVLDILEEEKLLDRAAKIGAYTMRRFAEMQETHSLIGDVRGKGLLIGVDLVSDHKSKTPAKLEARKVCWRCGELGLLLTTLGKSVLRVAPPLNIPQEDLDAALAIIDQALTDVEKGKVSDEAVATMSPW